MSKEELGEGKKKQASLSVTTSIGKKEKAHITQHEWALSIYTMYDPWEDEICLWVSESKDAWYFERGASKHKTSCKNFFVTLEDVS